MENAAALAAKRFARFCGLVFFFFFFSPSEVFSDNLDPSFALSTFERMAQFEGLHHYRLFSLL